MVTVGGRVAVVRRCRLRRDTGPVCRTGRVIFPLALRSGASRIGAAVSARRRGVSHVALAARVDCQVAGLQCRPPHHPPVAASSFQHPTVAVREGRRWLPVESACEGRAGLHLRLPTSPKATSCDRRRGRRSPSAGRRSPAGRPQAAAHFLQPTDRRRADATGRRSGQGHRPPARFPNSPLAAALTSQAVAFAKVTGRRRFRQPTARGPTNATGRHPRQSHRPPACFPQPTARRRTTPTPQAAAGLAEFTGRRYVQTTRCRASCDRRTPPCRGHGRHRLDTAARRPSSAQRRQPSGDSLSLPPDAAPAAHALRSHECCGHLPCFAASWH